jgi:hypothetical protein
VDKTWWREYRRALKISLAAAGWLIASIATGYTLAQIDHAPPASAVTPAPSGTGQLGRAPSLKTSPQAVPKRAPATSWKQRRQPRRPPTPTAAPATPTPSPAPSSTPPVPETSEPTPEVSPTP